MEFFTPPDNVDFRAKKLYGNGTISDVSLASFEGGGPVHPHTHPHSHLFIVIDGEAKIQLGNGEIILKKNESYLVPGEIPHSVWNHSNGTTTMLGINIMPGERNE